MRPHCASSATRTSPSLERQTWPPPPSWSCPPPPPAAVIDLVRPDARRLEGGGLRPAAAGSPVVALKLRWPAKTPRGRMRGGRGQLWKHEAGDGPSKAPPHSATPGIAHRDSLGIVNRPSSQPLFPHFAPVSRPRFHPERAAISQPSILRRSFMNLTIVEAVITSTSPRLAHLRVTESKLDRITRHFDQVVDVKVVILYGGKAEGKGPAPETRRVQHLTSRAMTCSRSRATLISTLRSMNWSTSSTARWSRHKDRLQALPPRARPSVRVM